MGKSFREVFAGLKIPDELGPCADRAYVERVALSRDRSTLSVYLKSSELIEKRDILRLEALIKGQLFNDCETRIKIFEHFHLDESYDIKRLWDEYGESIKLEIREHSLIEYNILNNAKLRFCDDGTLVVGTDDNCVIRSRADELKRILEKIIVERCGLKAAVCIEFADSSTAAEPGQEEAMRTADIRPETAKVQASPKKEAPAADGGARPKERSARNPGGRYKRSRTKHNDVLYGADFDDDGEVALSSIIQETGEVVTSGKVISLDDRELKSGDHLYIFALTDFKDSINVKMFVKKDKTAQIGEFLRVGEFLKVCGVTGIDRFDGELSIGSVRGIRKGADISEKRRDQSPVKRVELHCHTKMSDMDAVSDVKDIIAQAKAFGMTSIAITDHGCVQAFPDAFHTFKGKNLYETIQTDPFKVIYGLEGYLVDDLKSPVQRGDGRALNGKCVVFDLETTGLSAAANKIIEIGAVKIEDGQITDRFSCFVDPGEPIPYEISKLTGIDQSMVAGADKIDKVLPRFIGFCDGAYMVGHNVSFDMSFVEKSAADLGLAFDPPYVDTVALARIFLPDLARYKLDTVAKALGVSLTDHHRAVNDAETTAGIYLRFLEMMKKRHAITIDDANRLGELSADAIKKLHTYHVIILAKNEIGRINLYRLVSESHLEYFYRKPRIPKSELIKYREGLIIGSACEAGELFQAIAGGASDQEIANIADFYDYLEVQPAVNNYFMIREGRYGVKSPEDIQKINKKIIELGERAGKPVCATCDVHFLNPEDEIYRRVIMAGQGYDDCDHQPPLYLRTTQEMLDEFKYLPYEKAYEIVVENTNKIADMCERIAPVRPDKCPPVIADSDIELRDMCYKKARSMYGEQLPQIVEDRLERELGSIISNGFAVMYIIAQKLVKKSNDDGYLVGSRGSVGSSFVATMSGITEVNPLPPHYYCTGCHYSDFDSDDVKKYAGAAGCDMPDKICPVCGRKLKKDGFDIPFETFLGFKGDKEPDIDLNFSGEYQNKAHAYTEEIFGKGHTFRAGTIGTLADKTAYGYVKKYYDERGEVKRSAEINRIVAGCVGVRRTTGQHPGGIVVMPHGEEIYSFTPVQHPANDMSSDIVTTHFDYHSIDHNLLKLDILGHDDPTMIRMLENLTGLHATDIPLDSPEVMSLFSGTEALGITPDDIGGCRLGALGIPEFGTDFAMQMLIDAKPESFADLVRIAGLAHGTDVWLGNAQDLILSGRATLKTAICTRDDIMTYLISMGMNKSLSFTIMENVRKGKGLTPEWEEAMTQANVPDWYIESCKKIKYMFPKAHAAAYVMMAWRIAYFKVFYPMAYYTAYFSIRASGFSYALMCQGREKLEYHIADYKSRQDSLSKKEQDTLRDMRIAQEMYARGIEFMPIDLYRAKAFDFQIIDGKIMPSFNSIDGLGEKAAESVVAAVESTDRFLSLEDLKDKAKLPKSTVDMMADMGILTGLPKSNQMSLFDLEVV